MHDQIMAHVHGVILAGGSGARFWPLSREINPKQLLSVFGAEPLIAKSLLNLRPFQPVDTPVRIVTNERLAVALRELFEDETTPLRYLIEPVGRNTAAAIALVAAEVHAADPEGILLILPSDHLLEGGAVWEDTVRAAIHLAADGYLATIGLRPTRPETGYGYIQQGDPMSEYAVGGAQPRRVARMVEKPDAERARAFLDAGSFLWNAGIFCFRAQTLLDEMRALGGDAAVIAETCQWVVTQPMANWHGDDVLPRFAALPSISIDKLVLEHTRRLVTVPAFLQWDDVGSLLALRNLHAPDAMGNIRSGRGVDIDARDNVIYSSDRLVATLGVQDLVVVDTFDATLVCHQDRCQDVRLVVDALRALGANEIVEPRTAQRGWGRWTTLIKGEGFLIKMLEFNPGASSQFHFHQQRTEHWVVLSGMAEVTSGAAVATLAANSGILIPPGTVHRLRNLGGSSLHVLEIQVGNALGDDDVYRTGDAGVGIA